MNPRPLRPPTTTSSSSAAIPTSAARSFAAASRPICSSSTSASPSTSRASRQKRRRGPSALRVFSKRLESVLASSSKSESRPFAGFKPLEPSRSRRRTPSIGMSVAAAAFPDNPDASDLDPALLDTLADVAAAAADAASEVTLRYFRSSTLSVDSKADDSPVTVADRAAEAAVRAVLSSRVPSHAVFGEEGGMVEPEGSSGSEFLWVIDPIDGTKSFITGKPLWGTLVALLHRGEPVLGLIDQPVTRERWLGLKGRRTTHNGREVGTRRCGSIDQAYLYATTPHMFSPGDVEGAWQRVRDASRIPLYGCDCYAYGLLALGHADLVVEADLGPYDYLAIAPVVRGAGGQMTDWRGNELRAVFDPVTRRHSVEGLAREVVAAGDAGVHAAALEKIGWK